MNDDDAGATERLRQAYDDTPYHSAPLIHAQPGRLAARAQWAGLAVADAAEARVLEIGCASGGHLIPLAAQSPNASFLGVDLSPVQIAAGRARAERLGLKNLDLRAESFEALSAADGEFDFIICHGVYSWIPDSLRQRLIEIVAERLAPEGVAMVSFNVLPGWRLFQIARDSMQLNAGFLDDPATRPQRTRQLFDLLAAQSRETFSYGKFWRNEARRLLAGDDAYIAHEIFEDWNAPETFVDFSARLARSGLEYLSESSFDASDIDRLAPEGADSIRALAGGDRLKLETYADIFSGRSFREALIVRAGRLKGAEPNAATLASLHVSPTLGLELHTDGEGAFRLVDEYGEAQFQGADIAAAMRRLIERKPRSSRLVDLTPADETGPDFDARLIDALAAVVEANLAAIATLPVDCAARLPGRPRLWRVAALDALTSDRTVTLRHSPYKLAPMQRFLAPLIDGAHDRDELLAAPIASAERGELTLNGPDGPITDAAQIRRQLAIAVDQALDGLVRNGLIVDE